MGLKSGGNLEKYKLIRQVGGGAFGSVWLAEDTWLSKYVALKIPHNQAVDFRKLVAEPKMLAVLDHPNIIRLLTVEKASDTVFMVMDFVDGPSLRDVLSSGALPVPRAVGIAKDILSALAHAHEKGVVHRDLKPANILIDTQGRARITDFGTAHALQAGEETVAAGTLYYMSREQLLGRVMPASDLYSTGVVLFEMLTGRLPFHETAGNRLIQKILAGDSPPRITDVNPELPAALAEVVSRAMERDIRKRWRRAEEMLEALLAAEEGREIPKAPEFPSAGTHPGYETFAKKVPRLAETLGKTREFEFRAVYGERGKKDGQFMLPSGVTISSTGKVYVADAIRSCVQAFGLDGAFLHRMGREGTRLEAREGLRFMNPTGITTDREGRIYLCDTKNSQIQVFTEEGESVAYFGRPLVVVGAHEEEGVIGLNFPRGVAVDEEEELLYVADTGNNRLRLFKLDGTPLKVLGTYGDRTGEFNTPVGVAVGLEGMLYVADSQNYRIQVFERGFRFHAAFGHRGGKEGQFMRPPTDVTTTVTGELIVCDDTENMHVFDGEGNFLGYIAGPRRAGTSSPKYYSVALKGLEGLYAVDDNRCELHHFAYKEKKS